MDQDSFYLFLPSDNLCKNSNTHYAYDTILRPSLDLSGIWQVGLTSLSYSTEDNNNNNEDAIRIYLETPTTEEILNFNQGKYIFGSESGVIQQTFTDINVPKGLDLSCEGGLHLLYTVICRDLMTKSSDQSEKRVNDRREAVITHSFAGHDMRTAFYTDL